MIEEPVLLRVTNSSPQGAAVSPEEACTPVCSRRSDLGQEKQGGMFPSVSAMDLSQDWGSPLQLPVKQLPGGCSVKRKRLLPSAFSEPYAVVPFPC
ncbi:hypothetical protein Y1Q_0007252 [Alligator mississippiensis]|uniref:Uncharacterized protein n=1 Tax=Alligator mississippiensis TaxID=8496 RepID=A0A151NMX6_ALLMI|nr:hypothetical protein Y1Q_0007252 [Alligator mississippiensis]